MASFVGVPVADRNYHGIVVFDQYICALVSLNHDGGGRGGVVDEFSGEVVYGHDLAGVLGLEVLLRGDAESIGVAGEEACESGFRCESTVQDLIHCLGEGGGAIFREHPPHSILSVVCSGILAVRAASLVTMAISTIVGSTYRSTRLPSKSQ